jgi:UDP-GlcNAc:undecaprenyl-phosphate GlcNAc-1-phosphate transferase
VSRRIRAFVVAAAGAAKATRSLRAAPPGGDTRWERSNFRGSRTSLLGGPAAVAGAFAGIATVSPAAAVTVAGAGALGLYDDLWGDSHARGLRGHIDALRHGRVTTGMVKVAGLVTVGAMAAALDRRRLRDALVETVLIAGSANLLNLFDLRPGRALKVATVVAAPLVLAGSTEGAVGAAAVAGTAAALLPPDLDEQLMLGDCGANALGALLGWSMSTSRSPSRRHAALAAVIGLTLASECVSFTEVVARTPWLAAIDNWGRHDT